MSFCTFSSQDDAKTLQFFFCYTIFSTILLFRCEFLVGIFEGCIELELFCSKIVIYFVVINLFQNTLSINNNKVDIKKHNLGTI